MLGNLKVHLRTQTGEKLLIIYANIVKGDLGTWEVVIVMSEHIRVKSLISTYSVKNINDDKFKEAVKYTHVIGSLIW